MKYDRQKSHKLLTRSFVQVWRDGMNSAEKCGQIWFFVDFGEIMLLNKRTKSIQNIDNLKLLQLSCL